MGGREERQIHPELDDRPSALRQGTRAGPRDLIPPFPQPGRSTLSELQTIIAAIQGDPSFRDDPDPFLIVGEGEYSPSALLDLIWERPLWGPTLDLVGALINASGTRTFVYTSAEASMVHRLDSPPVIDPLRLGGPRLPRLPPAAPMTGPRADRYGGWG